MGAAGCVAAASACARMGSPPGGPEDRRPPVVVRTEPDTFATVQDFRGPVRFEFDERISERVSGGQLDDAVIVSPRTGDVRVSNGRRGLSVELVGGFRPGLVYRVTLQPVVSDLFGNRLGDPFEIVFSTGAAISRGALVGVAFDRTTGLGVADLQVAALADTPDSTEYVARTDTAGIYVMRFLPPGRYRLTAYDDRNRNRSLDPMEPQGRRSALIPGEDTLFVDVPVLQPDTLPARLTRAQALDSLTVVLEFDDFLDPDVPATQASFELTRDTTAEEGPAPAVERVFHEYEYAAWVRSATDSLARLDSIRRADAARAVAPVDTAAAQARPEAQAPSAPAPPPALPAAAGAARRPRGGNAPATEEAEGPPRAPDGSLLPYRRLVVRLAGPLEVAVPYRVRVQGITNIALVPQGGGSATLVRETPRAAADSARADSLAADTAVADSTGLPPDTGGVALARLLRGR